MAEFGVYGVDASADGGSVIGRCHDENLSVGDVFLQACRIDKSGRRSEFTNVSLSIEEIIAYEHTLGVLYGGMTARIRLRGRGIDCLTDRSVLSTER